MAKPKDKFKSEKAPKLSKQNRSNFSKFKTKVKSLAKKGATKTKNVAKTVATKAKQSKTLQKVGTNLRQRLAISRTLGGNPYSPATGLNIPPSSVQDLATRSAQTAKQLNVQQRMAGIKNLSRLGIAKGISGTFWTNQAINKTGNVINMVRNIGKGKRDEVHGTHASAQIHNRLRQYLLAKDKKKAEEQIENEDVADVAVAKANIQTPTPTPLTPVTPKPNTPVPDTGGSSEPITPPAPVKKPEPTKQTFEQIWGRKPTSIQKSLMKGGWTAQELYQKKLAHEQWKKNRRRK